MNRPDLDIEYLTRWTQHLGLTVELAAIWEEAVPGEQPPA
jgi:hypothetical protein